MGLSKSEAYSVLELPLGASYEDIRCSYKRLALKWHPDKHNNSQEATEKFQEVSSAYKRLTSEDEDDEINLTPADMFDLFAHIFFQRNGMFGGYPGMYDSDNSIYSDDDEDDDDDDELDDEILQRIAQSFRKKYESKKPTEKGRPAHNLSEAEAMKNANELIEEEERDRRKAEKRRAKKKRNKERKKEKEREKKAKDEKENIQQQKNIKKVNIPASTKAPPKEPSKKRNTMATSSTPTKTVNNNTKLSSGLKEQSVNNNTTVQQSAKIEPNSPKRHDEEDLSGNEEPTWDTNSAFFARAAGRNPVPPPPATSSVTVKNSTTSTVNQSSENTKNISTQQPPAEQIDPVVLRSRQVAVKGNEMANVGNYQAAVEHFTQAINLDAKDFRFFGNRSYCYDRMGHYEKALQDADVAISLAPDWPKGYFRRGRALAGLKLFSDAESSFAQVLKLDKHCEDAMFELAKVRVQQLEEMGFPQSQSEAAIQAYGTVQAALEALLAGKVSCPVSTEIYVSDGEDDTQKQQIRMVENGSADDGPGRSLWVGNVNPEEVSERHLVQLFSRCGRVDNVRILPKRFCAFVNYDQADSAAVALEKLQGYEMGGEQLLLRYPNNTGSPGNQPLAAAASVAGKKKQLEGDLKQSMNKLSGPVNGDECYFWRTTGCYFADKCRFRHVPESKGVDLKRVEAKYGGKLRVTIPPSE